MSVATLATFAPHIELPAALGPIVRQTVQAAALAGNAVCAAGLMWLLLALPGFAG